MQTRRLGKTGLRVSEIGFGGWAIGGNAFGNSYGDTDDAVSKAAIRRALELGVTLFDTADVYGQGHSEALLGEVLKAMGRPAADCRHQRRHQFLPARRDAGAGLDAVCPGPCRSAKFDALAARDTGCISADEPACGRLGPLPGVGNAGRIEAGGQNQVLRRFGRRTVGWRLAAAKQFARWTCWKSATACFIRARRPSFCRWPDKRKVGILAREPLANGFLTGQIWPGCSVSRRRHPGRPAAGICHSDGRNRRQSQFPAPGGDANNGAGRPAFRLG